MTERECLDIIYSLKKCGINFLAIVSFTPDSFMITFYLILAYTVIIYCAIHTYEIHRIST